METYKIYVTRSDSSISYIENLEPYVYTDDISRAKVFTSRYTAEYYILRNYQMYLHLKSLLSTGAITSVCLLICPEGKEAYGIKMM